MHTKQAVIAAQFRRRRTSLAAVNWSPFEKAERGVPTEYSMGFRLIAKNPPSADLLAREGNDERILKLLRRYLANCPVIEADTFPKPSKGLRGFPAYRQLNTSNLVLLCCSKRPDEGMKRLSPRGGRRVRRLAR